MAALFACTKCNSRHPFEELSPGHQLCKDCRGAFPLVKCTYCRTEFQDGSKGSTAVCRKCETNVKTYGKPSACEYCNIIAAFIGSKCQRCTNSEKKYGPPVTCEQCKQRCAFDRRDDSRKKKSMLQSKNQLYGNALSQENERTNISVDGKLLCWLCTLSYKRALAKAKQNSSGHHATISLSKSGHHHHHKRSHSGHSSKHKKREHSPSKKIKTENVKSTNGSLPASESSLLDPSMSDHVAALAQLKDQISSLQKQLVQKDQQMLSKEKQFAEMKAQHGVLERELKLKIQAMSKQHNDMVDDLQAKVRILQKQVVTLTKANKNKNSTDSPQRL